ncbi:MAG: hypothetical protein FJ276_27000, partial [Planctomycetes bacterium]|nr:hypothetical protein [Planctomycetota bacterium]
IDGRTDIWALGVILYELLSGRRPFVAADLLELSAEIQERDPQPPRMRNPSVPKELERICLKCLAKRRTQRYATASDLLDDLQAFLATCADSASVTVTERAKVAAAEPDARPDAAAGSTACAGGDSTPRLAGQTPDSGSRPPLKIVPKGLRSFDEEDKDFFLELLPGPRDRDGLPDSIRFWKTRLERTDADATFPVGVMYGPSGCGKSSLVKAGLLPHLADHVLPVIVEATPNDTELRLLKKLRNHIPRLASEASLAEALAQLREGRVTDGRKVVLVLDQFEQWLHNETNMDTSQLVRSLRQCDGAHVQGLILVRDDFWLSTTRFMQALEIPQVENQNSAVVDLFDPSHARKVLRAFGFAYGRLPEHDLSVDHQRFLDRAVQELTHDRKVICVQLSLFADMMKGREWTPASLQQVGGTSGVGVAFLDDTFTARTAPPTHRLHAKAAQAVLKTLLPEVGTDIKGQMQPAARLMEASGYTNRPDDFSDLLRILNTELRLITPTDPEGEEVPTVVASAPDGSPGSRSSAPGLRFFQLTHDYLVPALRDWLTRKQKETRRGRAEIRLAERSAVWNAKPENRHLPAWWEYLNIRLLTDRIKWTEPQRNMMRRARFVHGTRWGLALIALAVAAIGLVVRTQVTKQQEVTRVEGLVAQLVTAEPDQLSDIIQQLNTNPDIAGTFLSPLVSASASTVDGRRAQLHARLATVSRDPSLVEPLVEELLTGKFAYVIPIRQQLRPSARQLTRKLWSLLRNERADLQQRFRAALALADYVPESEAASWTERDMRFVTEQLVSFNPEFQPLARAALWPVRARLLGDLERIFCDAEANDAQRLSAASAFADYAGDDIGRLSRLLAVATPGQFAVLYPLMAASPASFTVEDLGKIAATLPAKELGSVERVPYGQRRANAAVTLLRLGEREKVLPVFDMTDDPEALTQFIFRCRPRGVGVDALLDCLQLVSDAPRDRYPRNTRYALLLALGEFKLEEIPESRRESLLRQLADWYRQDPSSAVHGATGWLLRQWGSTEAVEKIDHTPIPYDETGGREWFVLEVNAKQEGMLGLLRAPEKIHFTFIVFPADEFMMGSPEGESDRTGDELLHRVKLRRRVAMCDREVTWRQWTAFEGNGRLEAYSKQFNRAIGPEDPVFGVNWFDAVGYCRWLTAQAGLASKDQCYDDPESLPKDGEGNPKDWPVHLDR